MHKHSIGAIVQLRCSTYSRKYYGTRLPGEERNSLIVYRRAPWNHSTIVWLAAKLRKFHRNHGNIFFLVFYWTEYRLWQGLSCRHDWTLEFSRLATRCYWDGQCHCLIRSICVWLNCRQKNLVNRHDIVPPGIIRCKLNWDCFSKPP